MLRDVWEFGGFFLRALGCSCPLLGVSIAVPFVSHRELGMSRQCLTPSPVLPPQLVSEKVGGAEGTKLDDDFKEMEKVSGEPEEPPESSPGSCGIG